MELKTLERVLLLNILGPVEGDVTLLRLARSLRSKIGFTDAELETLEFKQEGPRLTWKPENDAGAQIELTPKEQKVIATQLKNASAAGKLTMQHLTLYDKFCPEAAEDE